MNKFELSREVLATLLLVAERIGGTIKIPSGGEVNVYKSYVPYGHTANFTYLSPRDGCSTHYWVGSFGIKSTIWDQHLDLNTPAHWQRILDAVAEITLHYEGKELSDYLTI